MLDNFPFSNELNQRFSTLISNYMGLEIRSRDYGSLKEKIFSRMQGIGLIEPEDYYQLLASKNQESYREWLELAVLITNIESYFFRDKGQFNLLKSYILPEIIERQQQHKTIRICSAGCSSGEEIYSLAILLKELIPDLDTWNLMILGVDINQTALQKAKTGIYSPWSFRNIAAKTQQQYFDLKNNHYHINSKIKQMAKFENLNLVQDSFPSSHSSLKEMDLILCRNVFIYFDKQAVAKVMDKIYHALRPLGYLLTGHAELYGYNLNDFQTKVFQESLVYQRLESDNLTKNTTQYLSNNDNYSFTNQFSELASKNYSQENYIKMQKVSLNLLKQLPPDTTIPKLGNLTVSQLILQLEETLEVSED